MLGPVGRVGDIDAGKWSATLHANLTGMWLSMKYEIAQMLRKNSGTIVNMSSTIGAHVRIPGMGAYVASKAGVSALTRAAALEYIRDGIRINAVSPGPSDTRMSFRPGESEEERAARIRESLPLGRVGTLDEVADTVLWLASDQAGFAVGHDLVIDGGASA